MELTPGLSATVALTVTDADTAVALRSGDVPVLATPRIVALVEEATVAAVAPALASGQTTVGTRVEVAHLAPSLPGSTVVAQARLETVDGRRLAFSVTVFGGEVSSGEVSSGDVSGGGAVVARSRVERVVVDREKFLARAAAS